MHFYTSINSNYLPKARVLAESVKKYCPQSRFSLVFADEIPEEFHLENENFDEILLPEDLGIPVTNLKLWIFEHTVVELCTAIKGQALVKFLEEGSEKVVYLDPDIAVFDDLKDLDGLLETNDIVVTPHQTIPETEHQDIINNEICSLKHGIYNFGFYAVKNSENGLRYAHWWRDRLVDFCYDDIPGGLFTDQRWGDLAPAMFEGVCIWIDPGCNVSTWNLTNRSITRRDGIYYVNGSKLKFYHFSGFDSGAQKIMLDLYGKDNPYLYELRQWYIDQQEKDGQKTYGIGFGRSKYNYYDNGEPVSTEERRLMRSRMDLLEYFAETDPYIVEQERSYYYWYRHEMQLEQNIPKLVVKKEDFESLTSQKELLEQETLRLQQEAAECHQTLQSLTEVLRKTDGEFGELQNRFRELQQELESIKNSRVWRFRTKVLKILGR